MPNTRFAALLTVALLALSSVAGLAQPPASPARLPPAWSDGLLTAQAVSGFEGDLLGEIQRRLPKWAAARVDSIGNLIVSIGQGAPHVLVTASVDEDGYLVSDITPEGYLRLQRVTSGGGYRLFDQFLYGQPIVVRTTTGRLVPGVAGTASTHLQRGRDQMTATRTLDDLWVDLGAESRGDVAKLGVQLLDTVTLRLRGQDLAGGRTAGVSAQARHSALALLWLLREHREAPKVDGTLTFAWTVQGLFGDRGTARLACHLRPDRVIVITRAQAGREPDPAGAFGRLGSGPIVVEGDAASIERARQAGVPVQTLPSLRVPEAWNTVKAEAVALPVLFMQSPVETVDHADMRGLVALLRSAVGLPATTLGVIGSGLGSLPDVPAEPWTSLAPLAETYGVSGHEHAVREAVARQLPPWARPEVDQAGNLTVTFGGSGPEVLFVAHMDEIGYEITDIRADGTAAVRKRGGFFDSLPEAHPVLVHTASGVVPAVIRPRPGYMRAIEIQPKPEEVSIGFGTDTRAASGALGVKKGDTATVRKEFVQLAGTRATARSIDNRAGCAALTLALKQIDPGKISNRVTFAWVTGEEIGLVGAGSLAERIHPAYAFAVDTFVSSDSPLDPQRMARIPLGSGAVLRAVDNSSITPAEVVARVRALAGQHGIPVTVGVTSGGNDGSQFTKVGSTVLPLSWPGRYSHSPVEVIDSRDLYALVDLIVALTREWR